MRSARTVVRQSMRSAPVLVAGYALVTVGCVGPEPVAPDQGVEATGGSGGGGSSSPGGAPGLPSYCNEHPVSSPPGGGASVSQAICSATMEPVLADGAVRLSVAVTDHDPSLPAVGSLSFPEELREQVHGPPVISIVGAYLPDTKVSAPEQTTDGYSFELTFGPAAQFFANDQTRLSLRVAFDFGCETGSRLVHATTEFRLCGGTATPVNWSGPGDTCVVCYLNQPASPATPDTEAANR